MSAGVMFLIALLPGMPMLPFALLGGGAGYAAWRINKTAKLAPPLDAAGRPDGCGRGGGGRPRPRRRRSPTS